jgi:ribosomal protein S27AE
MLGRSKTRSKRRTLKANAQGNTVLPTAMGSVSTRRNVSPQRRGLAQGRLVMPMSSLTRRVSHAKCIGIGMRQWKARKCIKCLKKFEPTGANCKRCSKCRRIHFLESCKKRWHRTYVKKGYNQKGKLNNAWRGGISPKYYQEKAFSKHGKLCQRCGEPAVLVHHKDDNRRNSDNNNLEVLCKKFHQLEHNCADNLPSKVVFKHRVCTACSKRYRPTGSRQLVCQRCRA